MKVEMIFLLGGTIGLLLVLVFSHYRARVKLTQSIRQKWGKVPESASYIQSDSEESLKAAWLNAQTYQTFDSKVDDLTWEDLDLWGVFQQLNLTYSSVGSEALYQQLRNYNFGQAGQYEELIQFFAADPALREQVQSLFADLGKQDQNHSKDYLAQGSKKQLGNVGRYYLLGSLPLVGIGLTLIFPPLGLILTLLSIFINVLFYYTQKFRLEIELDSMRYLVQTIVSADKLSRLKTPLQQQIAKQVQVFKGIEHWAFSFRIKANSEAEIIFELFNLIFMLPFISYNYVLKKISLYNSEAVKLWELLGQLEVALAILNFRTYMPLTCQPTFTTSNEVLAQDSYHPLVTAAVPNPIAWKKATLITGSNASGKSTYVKSIAINCILAQTINTTTARRFSLASGHVCSAMAVEDDLVEGDSYFVAEIKAIKRLLTQVEVGDTCYCFIDEILKGTNTIERIAASAAVVKWLTKPNCLALIATHDIELTTILKNDCDNVHFEEQVSIEKGITFDYQVKEGPATTRNAIKLLQVFDYPAELVTRATAEANYFEQHKNWKTL